MCLKSYILKISIGSCVNDQESQKQTPFTGHPKTRHWKFASESVTWSQRFFHNHVLENRLHFFSKLVFGQLANGVPLPTQRNVFHKVVQSKALNFLHNVNRKFSKTFLPRQTMRLKKIFLLMTISFICHCIFTGHYASFDKLMLALQRLWWHDVLF